MAKYKVTLEYSGTYETEVEADSRQEAVSNTESRLYSNLPFMVLDIDSETELIEEEKK